MVCTTVSVVTVEAMAAVSIMVSTALAATSMAASVAALAVLTRASLAVSARTPAVRSGVKSQPPPRDVDEGGALSLGLMGSGLRGVSGDGGIVRGV